MVQADGLNSGRGGSDGKQRGGSGNTIRYGRFGCAWIQRRSNGQLVHQRHLAGSSPI